MDPLNINVEYFVKLFLIVDDINYQDPYIAELAKREANGICQLCGNEAPFVTVDGKPYLESHHIVWLSGGGADTIENTVAVCPNCHRKLHYLNSEEDVEFLKSLKQGNT
ncbi:MAG: HNH endonuclease [Clostridiales bacterium]|nr:HNH endonuclease [Clostridiales bacterium]